MSENDSIDGKAGRPTSFTVRALLTASNCIVESDCFFATAPSTALHSLVASSDAFLSVI